MGLLGGGLVHHDGDRFHVQSLPGLRPGVKVRDLSFDPDGALWMASNEGVFRLRDGTITHFGTAEGLVTERVLTVLADQAGRVWAGTINGLHRYEEGRFKLVSDEGVHRAVTSIGTDREGGLWVGTGRFA